ncbi:MAG TPA: hypothetical protein PLP05_05075 [Sedimentisphaerales bacterium]|nr:hypothetical protein [Sedimentisphaerales bacterium]
MPHIIVQEELTVHPFNFIQDNPDATLGEIKDYFSGKVIAAELLSTML